MFPRDSRVLKWKRQVGGGVVGFIGFMLSPLSWWNDLFVNVPLALAFAWMIAFFAPRLFTASFIVGYWMTNVLGFVLMHKAGTMIMGKDEWRYDRKSLAKDLAISLLYTLLIVALIYFRVFKPVPEYLRK
ncbi:MAG TPA: hypothetical protein VGR78_09935 [Verrucomicrobiae bacterium]|nr:hypothetical protein [Verrucomicrobiae bacterium]